MKRELLSLVYVLLNSRWTEKETFALYGIRKSNTTTKGKVSVAGLK
jgi:NADH:ubiquinone oxidoreductase subunit C